MQIKILIFFICLFICRAGSAQTYKVEDVPNVKLINNGYVSNPDTLITRATVEKLNNILSKLESETTVQVAVVVLRSIGTGDIFNFAQQLFTSWGIGKSKKDNGLLILMVFDQREIRFHTGQGLEGVLPDVVCLRIQQEEMVPRFREEDYDGGMIAGVERVKMVLSDPRYAEELRDDSVREVSGWNTFFWAALSLGGLTFLIWFLILRGRKMFRDSKPGSKKWTAFPEMRMSRNEWIIWFGIIPFGLLISFHFMTINTENHIVLFLEVIYLYFVLPLIYRRMRMEKVVDRLKSSKNYFRIVEFFNENQVYWLVMGILFPLPMLFFYFQYVRRKRFFRNHPRECKSCGTALSKLDEQADDEYLKEGQTFEEKIGSVDYDVWLCPGCKSREILNYVNRFSKYRPCPHCGSRAQYTESRRTVSSPTYTSTGTGQQTDRCKFCNKSVVSSYSIAKLTPPSSSSSSSGSSSSGSSGGSWGGGSSGGGGATSRW